MADTPVFCGEPSPKGYITTDTVRSLQGHYIATNTLDTSAPSPATSLPLRCVLPHGHDGVHRSEVAWAP